MVFPAHVYHRFVRICQEGRQSVAIANHISLTKELHYGVSLGSVMFVLYIQPHSNLIKRHSLSIRLFTDNIQINFFILP